MAAGAGSAPLGLAAPLMLLYYGFSIGITYNKWLMKSFPLPLLVTLLHLLLIFSLALSTSLDIGLSNWSFVYVTVSLYTMIKPSAILFILLFSLLFKLEEMRLALLLVVLLIAGGFFMFTYKSMQFNKQGFVLVLCASLLGSIRWTLMQILLQKADLGKLFLGGILVFGLGFSEFLLVSRTSSLTLSIAGLFMEICILFLAIHLLGDHLSLLNWLGFAVCLSGISLLVILKAMSSKGEKALKLHKEWLCP